MRIAILLACVSLALGAIPCHNSTGACHHNGKYECADGSAVPWAKRCDGVEDCPEGGDEFSCPTHGFKEQASCGPTCNCGVSVTDVVSTSPYYQMSLYAPQWDGGTRGNLMTGTPVRGMWGCNTVALKTSAVRMMWYKKGGSELATPACVGNTRRTGLVCCGRAIACICGTGLGTRCS